MLEACGQERGVAMGLVLPILVVLSLSIGVLSYQIVTSARQTTRFLHKQRAIDLAQAGSEDALFWFRRQQLLPVQHFDPTSEDSQDPSRGIVRKVIVDEQNRVKGVYVVERNLTKDITAERGEIGTGWLWKISVRGVVYEEKSSTAEFDQSPNVIVEDVRMTTEIRMLNINPAVDAAMVVEKGGQFRLESRGQLYGGNPGTGIPALCYKETSGGPKIYGDIRGDPNYKRYADLKLGSRDIFGLDKATLRNLSDYISEEGAEGLPRQLPDFALIFIQGDATFTMQHPLNGGGVLFVDGDLTLASGSNSSFTGMIYCTGFADFHTPSWIEGQVVSLGGGRVGSGGFDKATILFNRDVLQLVVQLIGNYRKKRTYSLDAL